MKSIKERYAKLNIYIFLLTTENGGYKFRILFFIGVIMKLNLFFGCFFLLSVLTLISCGGSDESDPYIEYKIICIGGKPELNSESTDVEFNEALYEIWSEYFSMDGNDDGDITFEILCDDILYEIDSDQWTWITGNVPEKIMNAFWNKLFEYNYFIGSCWNFNYIDIPVKNKNGTLYVINAIVTKTADYTQIRYDASKYTLKPKSAPVNNNSYARQIMKNDYSEIIPGCSGSANAQTAIRRP